MSAKVTVLVQASVLEEIRRLVADAVERRTSLSAPASAAEVLTAHPGCGLTERQLADEIMIAAGKAGVAVEIGRPRAA